MPGRDNIVITRDPDFKAEGCTIIRSLEDLKRLDEFCLHCHSDEVMIIGGAQIYRQTMPMASKMYITLIDAEFEGDTYFPSGTSANGNCANRSTAWSMKKTCIRTSFSSIGVSAKG